MSEKEWQKTTWSELFFDVATHPILQAGQALNSSTEFLVDEFDKKQTVFNLATLGPRYMANLASGSLSTLWEDTIKHSRTAHDLDQQGRHIVGGVTRISKLAEDLSPEMVQLRKNMLSLERKGTAQWLKEIIDTDLHNLVETMEKLLEHTPIEERHSIYMIRPFITPPKMLNWMAKKLQGSDHLAAIEGTTGLHGGPLSILNTGTSQKKIHQMATEIREQYERTGIPVTIFGHSHGGKMAYVTLEECPEAVKGIISLGSPINSEYDLFEDKMEYLLCLLERFNDTTTITPERLAEIKEKMATAAERYHDKNFTHVWSENDGLVRPPGAIGNEELPNVVNLEVNTSHTLMAHSSECYIAVLAHMLEEHYPGIRDALDIKNRSIDIEFLDKYLTQDNSCELANLSVE